MDSMIARRDNEIELRGAAVLDQAASESPDAPADAALIASILFPVAGSDRETTANPAVAGPPGDLSANTAVAIRATPDAVFAAAPTPCAARVGRWRAVPDILPTAASHLDARLVESCTCVRSISLRPMKNQFVAPWREKFCNDQRLRWRSSDLP